MKRRPIKRKTGLKRTPIRRVSKKLSKELKLYYALRDRFLDENRWCQCGLVCDAGLGVAQSTQVHHKRRRGKYLNDVSTWMAVCARCHEAIERNANYARQRGWLLT